MKNPGEGGQDDIDLARLIMSVRHDLPPETDLPPGAFQPEVYDDIRPTGKLLRFPQQKAANLGRTAIRTDETQHIDDIPGVYAASGERLIESIDPSMLRRLNSPGLRGRTTYIAPHDDSYRATYIRIIGGNVQMVLAGGRRRRADALREQQDPSREAFRRLVLPALTRKLQQFMHTNGEQVVGVRPLVVSVNGHIDEMVGHFGTEPLRERVSDVYRILETSLWEEPRGAADFITAFGESLYGTREQYRPAINPQTIEQLLYWPYLVRENLSYLHPLKATNVAPALAVYSGRQFSYPLALGARLIPGPPQTLGKPAHLFVLPYTYRRPRLAD